MSAAIPLPPPVPGAGMAVPARIGAYEVHGIIGTGSMGVVYLGYDPAIARRVAIKTIQRHLLAPDAQHQNAAARFRLEAQAAGRLNHRHIVSVYQFSEDPDNAFIAMEYVEGHSLVDYLAQPQRLGRDEVLCLMFQLLDALQYAHDAGVVHRDIKPANLMVDRDGRLKITDFGIARVESQQLTRVNAVVGSPGYMAPEQYTGGPLDRRVDIFSAGVLLYQMLAGVLPFSGSDEAIMYQIVYGEHTPLSKKAGDAQLAVFDPIIDTAIAKRPDARFAHALEFREALRAAAGMPVPERLAAARLLVPRPLTATPGADGRSGDSPTIPVGSHSMPLAAGPAAGASAPRAPVPPASSSGSARSTGAGSQDAAPPAFAGTQPPGWWPSSLPQAHAAGPATPSAPSSAAAAPAPRTSPGAGAAPGPGADPLAVLERELVRAVGPVARVLMQRATQRHAQPADVRRELATAIVDPGVRERFLAATQAWASAGSAVSQRPATVPGQAATGSFADTQPAGPAAQRITAQDIERAGQALVRHLGPMGPLLARRCAEGSPPRDQYVGRLVEQIAARLDPKAVESDLWRVLK